MKDAKPPPNPLRCADKPHFNNSTTRAERISHKYINGSQTSMTWACAGDQLDISFATKHGTSSETFFAQGRTGRARCPGLWVVIASPSVQAGSSACVTPLSLWL